MTQGKLQSSLRPVHGGSTILRARPAFSPVADRFIGGAIIEKHYGLPVRSDAKEALTSIAIFGV